jgi:acyl-CoA reductase-like NAD-dependent aldehyde dehydrogenase
MADERTDVIVATGGTGVVRAAYSSGNQHSVWTGQCTGLVDASADINAAARIVDSKAFDNPVLCTNESGAHRRGIHRQSGCERRHNGAHVLDPTTPSDCGSSCFRSVN